MGLPGGGWGGPRAPLSKPLLSLLALPLPALPSGYGLLLSATPSSFFLPSSCLSPLSLSWLSPWPRLSLLSFQSLSFGFSFLSLLLSLLSLSLTIQSTQLC